MQSVQADSHWWWWQGICCVSIYVSTLYFFIHENSDIIPQFKVIFWYFLLHISSHGEANLLASITTFVQIKTGHLQLIVRIDEIFHFLTHCGLVISYSNKDPIRIGSDDGLLPIWYQAITWSSDGSTSIDPWKNKLSFTKIYLKMMSAKYWQFCLGFSGLNLKVLHAYFSPYLSLPVQRSSLPLNRWYEAEMKSSFA